MFSAGKLNMVSYLQVIEKNITGNVNLLKDLAAQNSQDDIARYKLFEFLYELFRVKKRLDILSQEREKFKAKANQSINHYVNPI